MTADGQAAAMCRHRCAALTARLAPVGMLILFAAASAAAGNEPRAVIQGSWIATFGPRQFRGEWSAQALSNNPNAAVGSWTLFGDGNKIFLQGTWSAEKAAKKWRGTWSARSEGGWSLQHCQGYLRPVHAA